MSICQRPKTCEKAGCVHTLMGFGIGTYMQDMIGTSAPHMINGWSSRCGWAGSTAILSQTEKGEPALRQ